jgi:hypothetical protein
MNAKLGKSRDIGEADEGCKRGVRPIRPKIGFRGTDLSCEILLDVFQALRVNLVKPSRSDPADTGYRAARLF